jgi:hypothetical protein
MANSWLKTDCLALKIQHQNYMEEDHLMLTGLRSDYRMYYAIVAIPSNLEAREEAYKALRAKFATYIDVPVESVEVTIKDYDFLVEDTLKTRSGIRLDKFPWSGK